MTRRNPVTESSLISFISEWTRAFEMHFFHYGKHSTHVFGSPCIQLPLI